MRTQRTVAEVIRESGATITEGDVAEALREVLAHLPAEPGVRTSSAADVDVLMERSGLTPREVASARETLRSREAVGALRRRVAARAAARLADALPSEDVRRRLGLSASGLSRAVGEGRLFAVSLGSGRRVFPGWQFVDEGAEHLTPLPHLPEVVAAVDGVHPSSIVDVMNTPQEETGAMTPREWLAGGGDARPVLDALSGLARW